jgi:tetratricopeptide (TPR) repeat protein
MTLLDEARDNIMAALDYLIAAGRFDIGLDMANHLSWYWYRSGRFEDGHRRLKGLLDAVGPAPAIRRARGLHNCGWLTFVLGDWRSAHTLHGECLWLSREIGDSVGECLALSDLGVIERWLGNEALGWEYAIASVITARSLSEPETLLRAIIWAYSTTGGRFAGEPPVEELKEAVNLATATGDDWMLAHAFNGLGDLFCEAGDYHRAGTAYRNSLSGFLRLGDRYLAAWNYEGLGRNGRKAGRPEEALENTMSALEMFDSLGDELDVAVMLARIVDIGRVEGRPDGESATLAGAASAMLDHAVARNLSDAPQVDEALSVIKAYADIEPVNFLVGRSSSRAAAVEAAKRFILIPK